MRTSKLGLTAEEQLVVAHFTHGRSEVRAQVMRSAIAAVPTLTFAVYGVVKHELDALVMAVALLLALEVFKLVGQARYARLYRSVCTKIDAFENGDDRPGA